MLVFICAFNVYAFVCQILQNLKVKMVEVADSVQSYIHCNMLVCIRKSLGEKRL